jgi:ABC-type transporter Mla MlaB component
MTNDTMLPIGGTLDVRTTLPAWMRSKMQPKATDVSDIRVEDTGQGIPRNAYK